MTTFDVEKNEILIKENINQLQEYAASNELDFMKLLVDYKNQVAAGQIANNPAGTIKRIRYSYGSCRNGVRGVYQASFFLGVQVSDWTATMEDNGGSNLVHATVGCNQRYFKDLSAN